MRAYVAACQHETNSFSPIPTDLESFESAIHIRPSRMANVEARRRLDAVVGYAEWLTAADEAGWQAVLGPAVFAQPSAPATAETWRSLRSEILDDLLDAGPVDAVLLALHGAQLAEDCDDCEGDLITSVRQIVGPNTLIGVLLDLHGHVSAAMLAADAIIACLEYPHTDFPQRARQLFSTVRRALGTGERPFTVHVSVPMLDMHHTTRPPMADLVAAARGSETGAVRSVSLMHGFPWSDCSKAGGSVVVTAVGERPAADALARRFAERFFQARGEVRSRQRGLEAALDEAVRDRGERPVVIADSSDNPGGGAASDSTFFISALIRRGVREAGIAILWDPAAVEAACAAGRGASFEVSLGGHAGPLSGPPLKVRATVLGLAEDVEQGGAFERAGKPQGGALLAFDGLYVVVSGRRQQCVSPEAFTHFGLDPTRLELIVVKSMQHFHAGFAPIARRIIYASAPGALSFDLDAFRFRRVPRPIWPLDPVSMLQGDTR